MHSIVNNGIGNIDFMLEERCGWLSDYSKRVFEEKEFHNIFNPSFYIDDEVKILSFRAMEKDIMSSYFSIDVGVPSIYNISKEWESNLQCDQLIDPKVFKLDDDVYVTFNSGYVKGGNDIFVMKIYPEIETPKKIIYKGRKAQERNWSFLSVDNEVYAMYWLNPLKILRLKSKTDTDWTFVEYYNGNIDPVPQDITIGTQLCFIDGEYQFVGHRKILHKNKKIYLGKMGIFNFSDKTVKYNNEWISHSFESLFGVDKKHNKNLFSCTYFSGIQKIGRDLVIGYGINDVELGFSIKKYSN